MPRPIAADQHGCLLRKLIRGLMGGTTRPRRGTSPGVPRVPFITRRGCRVGGPSRRPNAALDSYNKSELTGALRLTIHWQEGKDSNPN